LQLFFAAKIKLQLLLNVKLVINHNYDFFCKQIRQ